MSGSPELRLVWEWEPAPGIRAPELRATFARLQIIVGDECVTLVEDRESASSRRVIAVSLYPLAEWLAYNWWLLTADRRHTTTSRLQLGGSSNALKMRQRHSLRSANDGFLFPELLVLPEGVNTRLVWRRDSAVPDGWPVRFLNQGEALAATTDLRQTLENFIEQVIIRLNDTGISGTSLEEEWKGIKNADAEEVAYCVAAARLGLDPYSEAVKYEADILRASEELDEELLTEFLAVANPDRITDDLGWISSAAARLGRMAQPAHILDKTTLRTIKKHWPGAGSSPWSTGYSAARSVRSALKVKSTEQFQIQSFIKIGVLNSPDVALQALGAGRPLDGSALVLGRTQQPWSKRFTLARALWHVIDRPEAHFLVTTGYSDQQKTERAFAAELLAPAEGIAEVIGADPSLLTDNDIEEAQRHFMVSSEIITHQIENQLAG